MKKRTYLFALGLLLSAISWAQVAPHVCGNSYEDQLEVWPRLQANIAYAKQNSSHERAITYIPVHFHLTKKSNGTGRAPYVNAMEALCGMNEAYAPHDIQFYLEPKNGVLFNENIESDGVHLDQSNSFLMQLQKHPSAMNIYVASVAASGNNQPGTTLAYYSPSFDWIVTRKDQMNRISETLPHEAGHFFSLMHTFWGWESESFTSASSGWPIAPVTSPGGRPTERQNGTNCTTSGDGICDTPPDYNFGFVAGGCPAYTGGAKDPLGTLVDPMENNTMSYYSNCPDWQFTSGQAAAMNADIQSNSRNYLDNNFQPVATSITTPTDLISTPGNNSLTAFFNDVDIKWQSVAGATHYLVDMDIAPNYLTPNARSVIVESTELNLTDLNPNTRYYLRVRPFNFHATCAEAQSIVFFTNDTASSTEEIQSIDVWNISPNPISGSDVLALTVEANASFDATISILDMAGKVVYQSVGERFSTGNTRKEVAIEGLSNGFYMVKLDSGDAVSTKKLVVVR